MKSMRNLVAYFLALVVAAFAVPGLAQQPEKKFSVSISPAVALPGATATVIATITNETPNGNSSINSMRLFLPAGFEVANSATDPATANWAGVVTATPGTGVVTVSNMAPLKPRQFFQLTLKAKAPVLTACTSLNWSAQAFTGSSFSGDSFRFLMPPEVQANIATTIATGLALEFFNLPNSVVNGETYNISVRTTSACGTGTNLPVAQVTLTATQGTISPTSQSGNTSSGAVTLPVTIGSLGNITLKASAGIYGERTATLYSYSGDLACKPARDPITNEPLYVFSANVAGATGIDQTGYAAGERGEYNKDGSPCVVVNYTFTNNIAGTATVDANGNTLPPNAVSFVWDRVVQPGAAYMYTVTWRAEYVDSSTGLPSRTTKICVEGDATPCDATVAAQACLSSSLPAPYGTLTTSIASPTASTIEISSSALTPPPVPFPIVIGSERMLVTAMAANVWTVTRETGGTAFDPSGYPSGAPVMSTPLPLGVAAPYLQKVMPACIVAEVWSTVPPGGSNSDCTVPDGSGPRACILPSTTIIDIGDPVFIR